MRVLDATCLAAISAAVIAVPFFLFFGLPIWMSRSTEPPQPGWRKRIADVSTAIFIASVLIGLAAGSTSKDIGHADVVRKLESLGDGCQISINGKVASNSKEVLSALKTLDWLPPHHSDPTKRIKIEISDHAPRIILSLARDSSDPRQYWVFWPKYLVTANNEIGRIKTPLFDAY